MLSDITADFDPDRDKGNLVAGDYEVDPLIWEIRRERRMEFVYEHSRLLDLKRWKKLHYMNNKTYPDTMLGLWVNLAEELPNYLEEDNIGITTVAVPDGNGYKYIVYDGTTPMNDRFLCTGSSRSKRRFQRSFISGSGRRSSNQRVQC